MQEELEVIIQKNLADFNSNFDNLEAKKSFITYLSKPIRKLLDNDFAALLQIMYRIDVSEKEFALTLHPSNEKVPELAIAELIYERLLLKAKIRAKYKNKDA